MGRLIDSWIERELPKLEMILSPPSNLNTPGIRQPEGGTTFPLPQRGPVASSPMPAFVRPPGSPSLGVPMAQQPTFGGDDGGSVLPENWRSQIPRSPQAQRFAQQNASSTFEVPAREQAPPKSPDEIETFDDLMAAAPEQTDAAVEILTQQLGGDKGVNQAYAQATGGPPPQGMSRKEKGMLLMEFGLRTLAHNAEGQGDAFGAVGKAGVETLMGHRQRKRDEVTDAAEAEDRKLRRDLMEAQTQAAKANKTQLKADRDGRLRLIDMATGTSRLVLDGEGNPVMSGGEGEGQFVFDLQRQSFVDTFCQGMTGDELSECKKNSLLFSKGGNIAELAFPEIGLQRRVDEFSRTMTTTNDGASRLRMPSGETKRWNQMTDEEQQQMAIGYATRFDINLRARATGARSAPPSRENNWGLTQQQLDSFPDGARLSRPLPNGVRLARRNGKVVQIDEQGNEIQ